MHTVHHDSRSPERENTAAFYNSQSPAAWCMAQKERVASAINRLTDRVFVEALSSRDQDTMADLVADFFCGDPDTDVRGGAR